MTMFLSSSHSDDFGPLLIIEIIRSLAKIRGENRVLCETTSNLPAFEARNSDCVQCRPLVRTVDEWLVTLHSAQRSAIIGAPVDSWHFATK